MNHVARRHDRRLTITGFLALLGIPAAGCAGYGDVSPAAYDYATALYAISNRQAADKLDAVTNQLAAAQAAGELAEHETEWLTDIVDEARAGDWQSANQHSRRMMEDQAER
jgi:hypothetical protein